MSFISLDGIFLYNYFFSAMLIDFSTIFIYEYLNRFTYAFDKTKLIIGMQHRRKSDF